MQLTTFILIIELAACFGARLNNYNDASELSKLQEELGLPELEEKILERRNVKLFTITVDNSFRLYFDGVLQPSKTNANDWRKTDSYELPPTTQVIGVKATDDGLVMAGILASTSDGSVLTNGRWRCSNNLFSDWEGVNFNDIRWPNAVEIGTNGVHPWYSISSINSAAKWIWTNGYQTSRPGYTSTVYCRLRLASSYRRSCKEIKAFNYYAPSGEYTIKTLFGGLVKVYCEMGLNGGGYTFLNPKELATLSDNDVQHLFTGKSSFLMHSRNTDGTQRYGVLEQLPSCYSIPLKIGLNQYTGYTSPVNRGNIGFPYLYFGFLPVISAANRNQQGIKVNGVSVTFTNCDANPNSYIALFPNLRNLTPSSYMASHNYPFCNQIFANLKINPSIGIMPGEYFQLGELHFGGCGCYTSTDRYIGRGILSVAIGFR